MGSIWTVAPETVRLDGEWRGHPFWVEVKRELTEGEHRRVQMAGFKGMSNIGADQRPVRAGEPRPATSLDIDWISQSYTRTLTWLVDWSLTDDKGNKLALCRDTLEQLHRTMYAALEALLNAHVTASEEEKKLPDGERGLRAISA